MSTKARKKLLWLASLFVVVSLACGLGTPQPTTPPTVIEPTKEAPPPTAEVQPTAVPSGLVTSLADAKKAVIQIEAQGTFVNPDFTVAFNAAGRGSGFIIDPSGLAVTANHVVTGAALLKIWIGGDQSRTYNAKVLGVSECSDLALIDIDGDGYPYLQWYEGPITVGLDIYTAGFPLGNPEYTLTRGIISKERANGETSWASIDNVIEFDAEWNAGGSGGPLLDENGRVLGINYAFITDSDQSFAIERDLAKSLIESFRNRQDVDSIGINGEAFWGEGLSGVWVYSVKSGSPADKAGLTGGDIITTMEDLVLGTDGSMADYCDILRSHHPGDTLNINVLRYFTQQYLVGQINGRELEPTVDFGAVVDTGGLEGGGTGDTYSDYVKVSDDSGSLLMQIPVEWSEVDGRNWVDGDVVIGAAISAAADLNAYRNTWAESGVFFGASDDLASLGGYVQLLDVTREDFLPSCKLDGRYDYEDILYRGKYDLYTSCGDEGSMFIVLTAVPIDDPTAFLILVEIQITRDADLDALEKILDSFEVVGVLP